MIDAATIRRDAGLHGHEIGADDRCVECGLRVADMVVLQDMPPCDLFGHAKPSKKADAKG